MSGASCLGGGVVMVGIVSALDYRDIKHGVQVGESVKNSRISSWVDGVLGLRVLHGRILHVRGWQMAQDVSFHSRFPQWVKEEWW